MSKKNTSVLWSVDQSNSLEATDRARAQKNIGLSTDFVKSVGANNFVSGVSYDNNKNLQLTSSELNLSAIKATTPDRSVVTDNSGNVVVNDLSTSTPSASGTATSFISALTQNSIGKLSSISKANLPEASTSVKGIVQLGTTSSTAAAGDHSHGNITKGGELTSSVASASSQYLVITEASNNKVARSSLAFDTTNGSNKILKKTGEWGDYIGTSSTTAAAGNHSHGNITNGGALTSSVASASNQYLVITEASNDKVARSSLAFDTTNGSNKILKQTGAWGDFIGTSATTAAAGNHSHAVAVASTSGTGGSAGFMSAADKEKLDNLNVVSVTADYGTFTQTTAGTFSDSTDLVFSTFTLDEMQSTHITFNNGTITLAPGVYRIDVDLYASVPVAILCNSIGNINHVQIDYTYEHTVYAPIHNIRKYTVNTTYSVTILHTQQMLNGTTITIPRMIITYIGDKA